MYQESVHTLAGPAMHLALQIGLHVDRAAPDFSRDNVQMCAVEQADRAILWRYCLLVCQRYVVTLGDMMVF